MNTHHSNVLALMNSNNSSRESSLPNTTQFEKFHAKSLKPKKKQTKIDSCTFSIKEPHEEMIPRNYSPHNSNSQCEYKEQLLALTKTRFYPNGTHDTISASVNPTKQKSTTQPIQNSTFSTQQLPKNHQIFTPMPLTTSGVSVTKKKNVQSTESPTSKICLSSSHVQDIITVDSPSSPSSSTAPSQVLKKNSVRRTIKEYYKIEGLLEKNDEGLQLLREYLAERRNDEMLIYLVSNREFRLMRQNVSDVNMIHLGLLREFKTIYENFVNYDSLTCMNIASSIREQFTQTLKEVLLLKHDEIPCQALCEKIEKCLDNLLFNIQLQFNNEIMTHFKKSSEFRIFVITKLIELSASETSSIMEEMEKISPSSPGEYLIHNILVENEMEEYSKTFAKKKLVTLEQIRHFTSDDYRDKIGMKKIGHLKRIVRVVNEHFSKK